MFGMKSQEKLNHRCPVHYIRLTAVYYTSFECLVPVAMRRLLRFLALGGSFGDVSIRGAFTTVNLIFLLAREPRGAY